MNKNIEMFKKYYANSTKEEIIEGMYKDGVVLAQRIEKTSILLNAWKKFCEVKYKNCIELDKAHWQNCINKLNDILKTLQENVEVDDEK